ncbi:transcriptional regulator LdtR [Aquisalinus flavus]|uniref:MarR family transcriptional regulator n=1 Tax=Aquisalinus flavus TaxID=1526572 RepID=A0A8J2V5J9_9PROT|nr:winged helix DNA-binding protein [Aquisalinus flavus]MBD0427688.1 winged helix DNA-binding protein [Aquisalinus flavus]UNE47468.1 winged helix DNA-binding protein [Aquisalinus flavus]GGD03019.1 MarR family transcriptional regulator [Aquisalinus flavus]
MVAGFSSGLQTKETLSGRENTDLEAAYQKLLQLIERLHRQLLDVIKSELERVGQTDVNAVQALLLYNIGDAELTAGELRTRGHYLGSNVSYNLKKLVDAGYISHERSKTDRRSVRVSLTDKGCDIRDMLVDMFERQLGSVEQVGDVHAEMMASASITLERLERFWGDQIRFRL